MASTITSPVTVKPLVWVPHQGSPLLAVYVNPWLCLYSLYPDGDDWVLAHELYALDRSCEPEGYPAYTHHPTVEAAQAAAQQEWEGFIRAAIEPPLG